MSIILIHPYPGRPEADVRLSGILSHALADREGRTIRTAEELDLRPGDRVLFALALDGAGQNLEYYRMLSRLRREPDLLEGCTAALIVDGPGELYTKSTAGELALAADMAGCALIGRPLVEGLPGQLPRPGQKPGHRPDGGLSGGGTGAGPASGHLHFPPKGAA